MRHARGEPPAEPVRAYLGLGSNVGDREAHLAAAVARLGGPGVSVKAVSPVYETEPWGDSPEPGGPYLNCAVRVLTTLSPDGLLARVQAVERAGGRERTARWGPRTIDVDILLYGSRAVRTASLEVPHPRLLERAFALVPLVDLDPELALPDGTALRDRLDAPDVRNQGIRLWRREEG